MAHRRKHRRRHARENPLSDTTKLVLYGLGAVVVVGGGYYLYKRHQSGLPLFGGGATPQLGQGDATRGQPPPGANAGGSSSTDQQKQQQVALFKLGDAAGSATNANTSDPNAPPVQGPAQALSLRQATNSIYVPPAPSVHGYRHSTSSSGGIGDADSQGYLNPGP